MIFDYQRSVGNKIYTTAVSHLYDIRVDGIRPNLDKSLRGLWQKVSFFITIYHEVWNSFGLPLQNLTQWIPTSVNYINELSICSPYSIIWQVGK